MYRSIFLISAAAVVSVASFSMIVQAGKGDQSAGGASNSKAPAPKPTGMLTKKPTATLPHEQLASSDHAAQPAASAGHSPDDDAVLSAEGPSEKESLHKRTSSTSSTNSRASSMLHERSTSVSDDENDDKASALRYERSHYTLHFSHNYREISDLLRKAAPYYAKKGQNFKAAEAYVELYHALKELSQFNDLPNILDKAVDCYEKHARAIQLDRDFHKAADIYERIANLYARDNRQALAQQAHAKAAELLTQHADNLEASGNHAAAAVIHEAAGHHHSAADSPHEAAGSFTSAAGLHEKLKNHKAAAEKHAQAARHHRKIGNHSAASASDSASELNASIHHRAAHSLLYDDSDSDSESEGGTRSESTKSSPPSLDSAASADN